MKGVIAWFVDNRVAANLLMWVLVVGGLLAVPAIRQEEFPNIETDVIRVTVEYPGASPSEVEESLCIRVEEALEGVEGIDTLAAMAVEGACVATIELATGIESREALDDVKSRIDGIDTFPDESERPLVSHVNVRHLVLQIAVSGDAGERTLKVLGQRLRDEIADLPGVSQVELDYARPFEISIEVSEQALRRHGLTLGQVADAVRGHSLDLPGGSLKTAGGQILLRIKGQAYRAAEFEGVAVLTRADGTRVTVGEIARVVDGFEDSDVRARFDGRPAGLVSVYRVGDEDTLEIAERVKAHLAQARQQAPAGIELTVWNDASEGLRERIDTLLRSARTGGLGVLAVLALALRFRLALWVAAGIPISLFGALLFFPSLGLTISTISVMAFGIVLGIVVDDAIIVGERIYARERLGEERRTAAIAGTSEVAVPVIFGVLTTVVAFLPLVLVPGRMGQVFGVIGITVILCLVMSLLESQLILPAHLAHRRERGAGGPDGAVSAAGRLSARWSVVQDRIAARLERFAADAYRPALDRVLEWRYLALATALGVLVLTLSLFQSGHMGFQFFPAVEGDRLYATLTLPSGTPLEQTQKAVGRLEAAAELVRLELDAGRAPDAESQVRHVLASIGRQAGRRGPPRPAQSASGAHLAEVVLELAPRAERELGTNEIAARWRELTGILPDAVELTYSAAAFHAGEALNVQLAGRDLDALRAAAAELREALARYDGVHDVSDSFRAGKQEVKLSLLPGARSLGLTQVDLARQVRQAFYGEEVQRIQRGQDDVRVMVRYPEDERRSLGDLEAMRIRAPDGTEVPFATVARAELGRGYATIRRSDGKRVVSVTADVDRGTTTPEEVLRGLAANDLPAIRTRYPSVELGLRGEQRERTKAMGGLLRGFGLALLAIYALLGIPLRSYLQPLVIMSAIPFGAIGAILGHLVMGFDLVFFSMLGIVALSGVVVNDSLLLVDFVNRRRAEGVPLHEAVSTAGVARFRPILLTSATTFAGLLPIMFLATPATFFMVPIAISLGFGVVLATVVTLFLVPSAYLMLDDVAARFSGRRAAPFERSAQPMRARIGGLGDEEAVRALEPE